MNISISFPPDAIRVDTVPAEFVEGIVAIKADLAALREEQERLVRTYQARIDELTQQLGRQQDQLASVIETVRKETS